MTDVQVLFDPFEEQFDLPTLLVKRGNDGGGQCKNCSSACGPRRVVDIGRARLPTRAFFRLRQFHTKAQLRFAPSTCRMPPGSIRTSCAVGCEIRVHCGR